MLIIKELTRSSFEFCYVIGKGGFGKVFFSFNNKLKINCKGLESLLQKI